MKAQRKYAKGGLVAPTSFPLADFGYEVPNPTPATFIPANLGPVVTAEQMREIGRRTLEDFRPVIDDIKPEGRHTLEDPVSRYQDLWARRYWRSQAGIERGRLDRGFARHRAHREPFPVEPPPGEDDL
jgi:hypothetical protein